jgi:ArsR family transcriptional regulator, arsenate/arsenite/antimonite-responsive transcriptional repressor
VPEPLDVLRCASPLVRPELSDTDAFELERLFRALADRHRLRIVDMLAQAEGEAICVCDFQDALGLKQPTASYHLKHLVDAGVLAREQRGRFAFYSLRPDVLERLAGLVRPREATTA